ncbi:hypothetical protein QQ020_32270, partial [Fulvivirgaceae bacterium BMA12]|nr:hypothetical protein [Fulvivirgaceae bacterium BMA12]
MNRIIWSNVITGVMLCILLINPPAVAANTYGDDLTCTPNVWVENFNNWSNGTTQDNGSTGWSRDISNTNLNNDDHVEVRNKRFSFNDTDGEAVWRSEVINISAYVDLLLTVDLSASGSLEDADYIRVYYKLNGGPEKILQKGSQKNFFDPIEANTVFPLNGNTLQIVVRARNSAENEFYYFDNVRLFSSKPRIVASGGNLSCDVSTVSLSASAAIPGATYSWTGPGGFTSNVQNPGVSVAGQYTVTITNPANGCSAAKTVEVTAFDGPEVWAESFDLADGTDNDNGATAWSTQIVPIEPVGGAGETFFDVRSKEFFVFNLDGEGIWTSEIIDISNAGDVAVSLNAEGFGGLNNNPSSNQYDYFKVFYKLNGGSETSIASFEGDLPFTTITSSGNISGNTLQIVLRVKTTGLEEHYAFDNVSVFSKSPNLGLTASGGSLSCDVGSVTLTSNATLPGVTYSWTGPNGFSSGQQNPVVSNAGTYTVTATAPSGCSESVAVDVVGPSNETQTIWYEKFAGLANGSTSDNGATAWSIENSKGTFEVSNSKIKISNNDDEGVWRSEIINIAAQASVNATVELSSGIDNGETWENADYIKVFYKLDGGAEIPFKDGFHVGKSVNVKASANWLTGNTIQVVVRAVTTANSERYYFDRVKITSNTTAGLNVTASAGGQLTCTNTQVILSTNISPAGASFSWVGPDGFSSTQATPSVSEAGTYAVTVTTDAGCSGTATVVVNQDIIKPNISASGGNLACNATTINLTANSTTPGVAYSWTGPGGFTSNAQNPAVSVVGQYTVTVTNTSNGCSSSKNVAVTADDGPEIWAEFFDLADGTTTDNGTTAWSTQIVPIAPVGGAGDTFFEVRSAEFYVFNLDGEGIWTSEAIDISSAGNVTISLNAEGFGGLDSDPSSDQYDYFRVFYKLDGGAETSIASFDGDLPFTTIKSTGNIAGSTLQIVLRIKTTGLEEHYAFDDVIVRGDGATGSVDVTASVDGELTCNVSAVTLSASSPTAGVTYSWTGPGGFTSTEQNPQVSVAGDYTVTATAPGSGCEGTAQVTVIENKTAPGATAGVSGEITCSVSSVTLQGSSTTAGVTYSWTGPGTFTSAEQNPTATAAGDYTLTVTDPSNGCTSTAQVTVIENKTAPGATAGVSGEITCLVNSVTLQGSSTTAGVSYSWTGPGTFTSVEQNPTATAAGDYTLTVTDPSNGCTSTAQVTVIENKTAPGATAGVSGEITCSVSSVTLQGSSITAGVSYSWTGPGTFTSAEQNPTATVAGDYTLTVTDLSNGCTSTDQVTVIENKTAPGATAGVSGEITCLVGSVTLQGSSTTAGVSYSWTGPGTFTSAEQNPTATVAGDYTLTVTGPSNGCTSTAQVTVIENKTAPGATAGVSGEITCSVSSVTLQGSSGTSGVSYSWTGPGTFTSAEQNPTATVAGDYTLTVTDPSNGCTSTDQVTVIENKTAPGATAGVSGEITCLVGSVTLQGSSTTAGVSYSWTGPGTFTSAEQNPTATVAGDYTLTVTDPSNGCTSTAQVTVIENKTAPDATAGVSGEITCSVSSVTLQGSSTTAGVSYSWTGPGTFTSAEQNPTATAAGDYTLTVTDPSNGCTSTAQVTVIENKTAPGATASVIGEITCSVSSVTLQGSSTTTGVSYSWTGPGTFTSAEQNPTATVAGDYTLTVTDPSNGCTSTAQVTVIENKTAPGATAGVSGEITCSVSSVTLQGSSGTASVSYSWTGPGTFTSAEQNPTATVAGDYTLTVTDPSNGCTSTAQVTVIENKTAPGATAGVSGEITCSVSSVTLQGSSTTADVTYSWTGPGTFTSAEQNPTATVAGDYTLTVTDPSNGCTSTAQVTVIENKTAPGATAGVGGEITCSVSSVTL